MKDFNTLTRASSWAQTSSLSLFHPWKSIWTAAAMFYGYLEVQIFWGWPLYWALPSLLLKVNTGKAVWLQFCFINPV